MFLTDRHGVARHDTKMPSRKPNYPFVYLKEWREFRRLSGPELGQKMGRDKFYISRIETGKQSVDKEERDLLGEALEVQGDELLKPPTGQADRAIYRRDPQKEEPVQNLRPLAKRLIKKFGEQFIDAVLEEAAEPKEATPNPRQRQKG